MKRGTPDHPKTLWLKAGLHLSKVEVVGLLELLFHFTARCSPQGDVGKWTNRQIAEGVDWGRDPEELVTQLTAAGFLDIDRKHRLLVHDWAEHADQAVKKYLGRNGLSFLTPSGRVRTKAVRGRTAVAVAVAQPSPAKPEPEPEPGPAAYQPPVAVTVVESEPPPTPATPDEARRVALERLGPPGEAEGLRTEVNALLREVAGLTSRYPDELLVAMSSTKNGQAIVSVAGCSSVPWLRVTRDRLIAEKLRHGARVRASPVEPTRQALAREQAAMAGIQGGKTPTTSTILEGMKRDRPKLGRGNGVDGGEPPGSGPDPGHEGAARGDAAGGPRAPDGRGVGVGGAGGDPKA